jgi:hypothetical protein
MNSYKIEKLNRMLILLSVICTLTISTRPVLGQALTHQSCVSLTCPSHCYNTWQACGPLKPLSGDLRADSSKTML